MTSMKSLAQPEIMQKLHTTISNSSTLTTGSNATAVSSSPSSPSLGQMHSSYSKRRRSPTQASDSKATISLCKQYLKEKNHLGLALIARQKGIPAFMRREVWPVLLKYHPYVISPYLSATADSDEDTKIPEGKVRHDLMKYFRVRTNLDDVSRNKESSSGVITPPENALSAIEEEIVNILEAAIVKFFSKWGTIIKYDSGHSWIALNLAEWFPPIPNSNYVLVGRDVTNKADPTNKHLTQLAEESDDCLDTDFSLDQTSSQSSDSTSTQQMSFAEVFERLVLVLLHSHQDVDDGMSRRNSTESVKHQTITDLISSNSLNRQELLFKSGNIETRISYFLVVFAKLLPELYKSLSEDDIINKNSNKNNQWLTWWFKYCGAKVLSKFDRGRLWDLLLGFRYPYKVFEKRFAGEPKLLKRFKKLYDVEPEFDTPGLEISSDTFWHSTTENENDLQWSQIDYQIQLAFIYVSILQKSESKLLEFDQFEITEFLNKLPVSQKVDSEFMLQNTDFVYNDFERLLKDAGELWRNWLWNEINDERND